MSGGHAAEVVFHDASFLGNTWIAPHSSAAYDNTANADGTKTRWFQYYSRSANGRTTWIGPYAESGADDGLTGNGPSHLMGYGHLAFGGIHNLRSPRGTIIREWGSISRAQFISQKLSNGYSSKLCLGLCDATGSVFTLSVQTPGLRDAEFRMQHMGNGWTEIEAGTAGADRMFSIWTGDHAIRPRGTIAAFKGTFLPRCSWLGSAAAVDGFDDVVGAVQDPVGLTLCVP
ncbi:MAG: hypothetical protein HC923_00310 [Myxococcales bacterium]|nr:hypothetical protein [Myxococcales bacterium]